MENSNFKSQLNKMYSPPQNNSISFSSVDLYHKKLHSITKMFLNFINKNLEVFFPFYIIAYVSLNSASWPAKPKLFTINLLTEIIFWILKYVC